MALYCFVTSYRRLLVIVFVSHFNEWMLMKKINRFIFKYFVGTASCFVMRFATGLVSAEGIFHLNKGSISMRRSGLRRQMAIQLRRDSFVYESVQTSGASSLNVSSRRAAIRYDRVSLHVSLSLSLLSLISLHSDWLIKRPQLGLDDLDRCTGHWPRTVWFFFTPRRTPFEEPSLRWPTLFLFCSLARLSSIRSAICLVALKNTRSATPVIDGCDLFPMPVTVSPWNAIHFIEIFRTLYPLPPIKKGENKRWKPVKMIRYTFWKNTPNKMKGTQYIW